MGAEDFFRHIFSGGHNHPTDSDPDKYPRHVPIVDDDVLLLLAEQQMKSDALTLISEKMRNLQEEYTIAASEHNVLQVKIFRRLRTLYPDIANASQQAGFRKHGETFHYVSWDPPTS